MQDFVNFVMHHWGLWLLFIGLLSIFLWEEMRTQVGKVKKLTAAQVVELMNHQQATVVDIRSESAFAQGHIIGSINLPVTEFSKDQIPKKLQKYKDKTLVVACPKGQQSLKLALALSKLGCSDVHILQGGLTAWQQANMPLTRK